MLASCDDGAVREGEGEKRGLEVGPVEDIIMMQAG